LLAEPEASQISGQLEADWVWPLAGAKHKGHGQTKPSVSI
jgi:hypothetical protein